MTKKSKRLPWKYVIPLSKKDGLAPRPSQEKVALVQSRSMLQSRTQHEKLFLAWMAERGEVYADQIPVWGKYILDFLLPTRRLIVELDGMHHYNTVSADRDDTRTKDLRTIGTLLRIPNAMVCEEHKVEVLEMIDAHVEFNAVSPDRLCWRIWASKECWFNDSRITQRLTELRRSGEIALRLQEYRPPSRQVSPAKKQPTIEDLLRFGPWDQANAARRKAEKEAACPQKP